MKQRTCAAVRRWMFATAVATAATLGSGQGALAQGGTTPPTTPAAPACAGTVTSAADAAGTQRPVCVTPQPLAQGATAGSGSSSGSSSDHDTTYGILIGATLVIAGSATSLYARRRRLVLGKPFRRRSA